MTLPLNFDRSRNMEKLRDARSYNDLVLVVSSIRTAVLAIHSVLEKALLKTNAASKINHKTAKTYFYDLTQFQYELEYARTCRNIIVDDKRSKFDTLLDSTNNIRETSRSLLLRILDKATHCPEELDDYAKEATSWIQKNLKYSYSSSFTLPDFDVVDSFSKFIVLYGVSTVSGYILPEMIIRLDADSITHDGKQYSYFISFPTKIEVKAPREHLESIQRQLLLHTQSVVKIITPQSIKFIQIDGVTSASIVGDSIVVSLKPKLSDTKVNAVLTKILYSFQYLYNLTDPQSDLIYSVSGTNEKIVTVKMLDRDITKLQLQNFRKALPLTNSDHKLLLRGAQ